MLVGNKCDLQHLRQVETAEGKSFAEKRGMPFLETSAANNVNVEQSFQMLLQEIYKSKKRISGGDGESSSQPTIFENTGNKVNIGEEPKPNQAGGSGGCAC